MVENNVKDLPRHVLEQAVMLRDPLRKIYLALVFLGKPSAPKDVAKEVGHARAYVHMRLIELEERKIVKRHQNGRNVTFEANTSQVTQKNNLEQP